MLYEVDVTVSANTSEQEAEEVDFKVNKGIIHYVEVQFPIGCFGLVHVKLLHWEHQFIPANTEGNLKSDGYTIPIPEWYPLTTPPYQLTVRAWNEDECYDHTITVRVIIQPEEVLNPLTNLPVLLRRFLKFMGVGG